MDREFLTQEARLLLDTTIFNNVKETLQLGGYVILPYNEHKNLFQQEADAFYVSDPDTMTTIALVEYCGSEPGQDGVCVTDFITTEGLITFCQAPDVESVVNIVNEAYNSFTEQQQESDTEEVEDDGECSCF